MKKLLLLITASSIGLSLSAQQNGTMMGTSGMFTHPDMSAYVVAPGSPEAQRTFTGNISPDRTAGKSTTVHSHNLSSWFYYWDANSTTSSIYYYFNIAPDSNIYDDISTTGSNIWTHGIGQSFDPTDKYYYEAYGPAGTGFIPSSYCPRMWDTNPFTVDSFFVPIKYYRNNNTSTTPDTLVIEIVATVNTTADDSCAFKLGYSPSASMFAKAEDSTGRFGTAKYTRQGSVYGVNEVWDSIRTTKQRFLLPLTLADTVGRQGKKVGLSPAMNIPPKGKVVSFVSFKSAFATTLGTATSGSRASNSNFIKLYAGNTGSSATGWPSTNKQSGRDVANSYGGSYQTGLIAPNQIRYSDTGFTYPRLVRNVLIPGIAYNDPFMQSSDQAFHITWTAAWEDGVTSVNKIFNRVNAFPNPANNTVNVSFDLSNNNDVTVSLINPVGQVVGTETAKDVLFGSVRFNTTELPSGVYFYTVVANGQRSTGNVVVAH